MHADDTRPEPTEPDLLSLLSEGDQVNHPLHYNSHPSGVECISIVEYMTFNVGSAVKYLWRAGLKLIGEETLKSSRLRDLKKAHWYIGREIDRLENEDG